nr:phage major capsid protein [Comamonas thiooxydans]
MSKIHEIRSERAQINDRVQALAKLEAENGSLTVEEQAEFGQLTAQFEALSAQIERLEAAERMAAAAAVPVSQAAPTANRSQAPPTVPAQARTPDAPGTGMAQMVVALAAAQGNRQAAAQLAIERGYGEHIAASLNTLTSAAGGVLVPTNLSSEVIELLRPKSTVRKLGARPLPLNNGNMTIPRLKGGAVVGYIGSDSDVPATQGEFDDLKLSGKKLAALVPISNDLLANSSANPNVDAIVVGDLTSALAAREDKAFLRDDGTSNTPKGLRHWALPANVFAPTSATPALAEVDSDLNKALFRLENANANMTSVGWVMNPRTFRFLASIRDGNGNKAYPELDNGFLKGYAVAFTTQIPANLTVGADSNGSELYLADFGDCFIGEDEGLVIDYSKEATYKDGQGNVISAFQRDQTLIRVIAKHDFGPRHVESIVVLKDVQWGSSFG